MMTATKRRQYKSGAVYQRASDNRWIGTFEAGEDLDGKRRRITVSALTEAQCNAKLDAKKKEIARDGVPLAGIETRTTVEQWAKTWLPLAAKRKRAKSFATDASIVKVWIVPVLGRKRLDKLSPKDLRDLEDAVRAGTRTVRGKEVHLANTTAIRVDATFRTMLKDAIAEGHEVPRRLAAVSRPPKAKPNTYAVPTTDVRRMLILAEPDAFASARWITAFLQGMRQSECLGLTWDRVDLDTATIRVDRQLQALPYKHGCGNTCGRRFAGDCPQRKFQAPVTQRAIHLVDSYHLVEPKTESGIRIIPMAPWTTVALQRWRDLAPVNRWNLVWPDLDTGRPRSPNTDRNDWHALQDGAGVTNNGERYHLHEARHTTATLLLEAGVDVEVIRAIVGHSDVTTTRGYQHVSQTLARKALEDVTARLQLG